MQTPVVFIEKAFLSRFQSEFVSHEGEKEWDIIEFHSFLTKLITDFKLVTDFEDEKEIRIALRENTILDIMSKRVKKHYYAINLNQFLDKQSKNFNEVRSAFSLFLVDQNDSICEKYENETGFLFLNVNRLRKLWPNLSRDHSEREKYLTARSKIDEIESNRFKGWSKMPVLKQPVNTIFLHDPYLFKNKNKVLMEQNLSDLVNTLVLEETENNIQFLILCDFRSKEDKENEWELKNVHETVKDAVAKPLRDRGSTKSEARTAFAIRFKLLVLEIFLGDSPDKAFLRFHDRFLLTNNLFIHTPGGFDIDLKKPKNTSIRSDFIFYRNVFTRAAAYMTNVSSYTSSLNVERTCHPPKDSRVITNFPFITIDSE